jgi:hypothetical protein
MISIGVLQWILEGLVNNVILKLSSFFLFPEDLFVRSCLFAFLIIGGELIIHYEKFIGLWRNQIKRMENEKKHIFNVGLKGNTEIREKVIVAYQAFQLYVDGRLDIEEFSDVIEKNLTKTIAVLDGELKGLEVDVHVQSYLNSEVNSLHTYS